jgi:hypothetical protein
MVQLLVVELIGLDFIDLLANAPRTRFDERGLLWQVNAFERIA